MHIDELRAKFGLSRRTIWEYSRRHIIPPPRGTSRRTATYGPEHVAAIEAYRALTDFNTIQKSLSQHLQEENIDLPEYVRRREAYLRENGIAPAGMF